MSAGVVLCSCHFISDEELAEVLLQSHGVLTPESPAGYFGGLIDGEDYIWVFRIPCYDGVFDDEGNFLDENDRVWLERAKFLIGGEFQTWIYVNLGKSPGGRRLAVRFAYACCQRWPCVVVDNNDIKERIFSSQEIEQLYQEGGEFTYGTARK